MAAAAHARRSLALAEAAGRAGDGGAAAAEGFAAAAEAAAAAAALDPAWPAGHGLRAVALVGAARAASAAADTAESADAAAAGRAASAAARDTAAMALREGVGAAPAGGPSWRLLGTMSLLLDADSEVVAGARAWGEEAAGAALVLQQDA